MPPEPLKVQVAPVTNWHLHVLPELQPCAWYCALAAFIWLIALVLAGLM